MIDRLEHRLIGVNGIRLHLVQAGDKDGPLVILLHGFPEFWYGFRRQISSLAKGGYRVWCPDQRGYNLSEKPEGVTSYGLDHLAGDVLALIEGAGEKKAFLIGHDWGAVVAWYLAMQYPRHSRAVVAINGPHPGIMHRVIRNSFSQMIRSSYALAFQIPRLPETIMRLGNWWGMVQSMEKSSRPETFSPKDFVFYREAWGREGAITAMLNWYRAFFRAPPRFSPEAIKVPLMLIWGARDQFLTTEVARASIEQCEGGRLVMLPDATHWVHHEEPELVNRLIVQFLGGIV
ncbi:MAG: alpha/beta hydrolase [Syntrophobacteraceae bacterium]